MAPGKAQTAEQKPSKEPAPTKQAPPPKNNPAPAQRPSQSPSPAAQAQQKPTQTQVKKPSQAQAPAKQTQAPAKQAPVPKPTQAPAKKPPQASAPTAQGASKPSQAPTKKPAQPSRKPQKKPATKPAPQYEMPAFLENLAVLEFIERMVAEHHFEADELIEQFSKISPNERVLSLFKPAPPRPPTQPTKKPPPKSWASYSSVFLSEGRAERGVRFWKDNEATLKRAQDQYGVPAEIVVAIIGVETLFGRHMGGFCVMEALASLAFFDHARAAFFLEELEHFLLLARKNVFDPLKILGSYAGAIGIPQFMPGSWRRFAVDFDGDGRVDLQHSFSDAIGSVANYLKEHGWTKGQPIAHRATMDEGAEAKDAWPLAGMLPSLKVSKLVSAGVLVEDRKPGAPDLATFIELETPGVPTEYWLGYGNYYAITRYNRSHYYAMSVFLLAEEVKAAWEEEKKARKGKGR